VHGFCVAFLYPAMIEESHHHRLSEQKKLLQQKFNFEEMTFYMPGVNNTTTGYKMILLPNLFTVFFLFDAKNNARQTISSFVQAMTVNLTSNWSWMIYHFRKAYIGPNLVLFSQIQQVQVVTTATLHIKCKQINSS
jgi:hypothetical protein